MCRNNKHIIVKQWKHEPVGQKNRKSHFHWLQPVLMIQMGGVWSTCRHAKSFLNKPIPNTDSTVVLYSWTDSALAELTTGSLKWRSVNIRRPPASGDTSDSYSTGGYPWRKRFLQIRMVTACMSALLSWLGWYPCMLHLSFHWAALWIHTFTLSTSSSLLPADWFQYTVLYTVSVDYSFSDWESKTWTIVELSDSASVHGN